MKSKSWCSRRRGVWAKAFIALVVVVGASERPAVSQSGPGTYEGVCVKGFRSVSYPDADTCGATYSCFLGVGCSDICYPATWTNARCDAGASVCTLIRKRVGNQVCLECKCPNIGLYSCIAGDVYDAGDVSGLICQGQ